ncbi:MAG TPA: VRR-NUC domain-containing protein [Thermodesulfobacteriota bacterium]|nr:VRR-NUC domain-containing protein [Thermodesulfobacteriota bacterium]
MKESGIISAIAQYLQYQENAGRLIFIRNNTGAFTNPKGKFFRMGKPGSPDFLVFIHNGRCLHIEVKNEKGKLNENQIEYSEKIKNLGHDYHVARNLDDVERLLAA